MSGPTCTMCAFYGRIDLSQGECRRFPPTNQVFLSTGQILGPRQMPNYVKISTYPEVKANDPGCGEFKVGVANA
jgi:hypothetical protein